MTDALQVLEVLDAAAVAVRKALDELDDWRPTTERAGQYALDLVADDAAVDVLVGAGFGVLSEESGVQHDDRPLLAVLDPIDGSTNASHGVPWFNTSICVLDDDGPLASIVVHQVTGTRFHAVRGGGAFRDGVAISPSGATDLSRSLVGISGLPAHHLGWRQFRALGAAALDLCLVASGALDAYVDVGPGIHGPWDYLGGMLICEEAGVAVVDGHGRPMVMRDHGARRAPVAAATPGLLDALLGAREAALAQS